MSKNLKTIGQVQTPFCTKKRGEYSNVYIYHRRPGNETQWLENAHNLNSTQ
jgi:hypothetical protein